MKIENLTEEHIEHIYELWDKHMGRLSCLPKPSRLVEVINESLTDSSVRFGIQDGYRTGSKWSINSKLRFKIDIITKEFYPNFDDNMFENDPNRPEAIEAGKRFVEEATKYLNKQ